MPTYADKLPSVLTFPGTKQSSISVERALKNAWDVIMNQAEANTTLEADKKITALGDLELMIKAVKE